MRQIIKKILLVILTLIVVSVTYSIYVTFINPKSPKGISIFKNEKLDLSVTYYRPYKKGRLIFGEFTDGALVPFETYWRLGANFATVLESKTAISIDGNSLPAGAYRVYAIPYTDQWVLAFNSEAGAFGYSPPDNNNDLLRIFVPVQRMESTLEQFTIDFLERDSNVILRMRWDTTAVEVQIE